LAALTASLFVPSEVLGQQAGERAVGVSGAGMWYPADSSELLTTVDAYISASPSKFQEKPVALIVPHAGYVYSGPVAGASYASLVGHTYKRVLVFGLSHSAQLRGASVLNVDAYETPLGRIPVNVEARDALLECAVVAEQTDAHLNEHSVENQLPMLQRALSDFELVEVLVGEMTENERATLANTVRTLLDEETLLVVSTDFTHYGPDYGYVPFEDDVSERLQRLHVIAVREILEIDVPGWDEFLKNTQATICGRNSVALLLETLQPFDDMQGRSIAYALSGDITGDFTNSVTYSGIGFWQFGTGLNDGEKSTLLQISRDVVTDYFDSDTVPTVDVERYELTPRLASSGAAFVTLRNAGELRGCIGDIVAMKPLFLSAAENAYQASMDPRFQEEPVTRDEVPDLQIEVSVLTPMRRLLNPLDVRVGTDGVLIIRGRNAGVLLPQVPIEEGWDREQYLAAACLKAGLPADAWQHPQTEIYRFSAEVFGEEEPAKQPILPY
jgi:AmmeMemoRadiSam system protein B/AmmeMemoRadiSam system protein A